jgi:hypothetical protein
VLRGQDEFMEAVCGESILDVMDSDYRGIGQLASQLARSGDRFDREVETARLVREIIEHQVAAEQYLLPLIRRALPAGADTAHGQFLEHRGMEDRLRTLESLDAQSPAFGQALERIHAEWDRNGRLLDREVFPQLRARTDPGTLIGLASHALAAEVVGPTRPRHIAVEQPSANALLSLAQGYVDMFLDAETHRGHAGTDQIDALLQAGHYDDLEDPDAT